MDVSFSGILTHIEELLCGKKTSQTKKQRKENAGKTAAATAAANDGSQKQP